MITNDFQKEYVETRRQVIAQHFSGLNDRQREAVFATQGPVLVLAGAGSGKTTVLINRIENILCFGRASDSDELPCDADEQHLQVMKDYLNGQTALREEAEHYAALDPAQPWQVIAITFTNKAADEMKQRLSRTIKEGAEDIWARTFHSACVRILRRYAEQIGYPSSFTIYDTSDCQSVMKRIIRDFNKDEKTYPVKWALNTIAKARDAMIGPEQFRRNADKSGDFRMKTAADFYEEYSRRLFAAGAMDFDDLLYNTVRLLKEHDEVRSFYQKQFHYVLIDEYQDTNNLQYMLSSLLAGERENICVVGDDDQSIYSFRGATIENILSFEKQYSSARVIRLEQNYRSTAHILNAANAVIAKNTERKGKKLWTDAGDGERINLYVAKNEDDEAQYVVRQVLSAVHRGVQLKDNAVLYRTNAQSRTLEQAFLRNGIRPKIVKGNAFFERAEIKDILAYFFLTLNTADDLRLNRIINVPARGIGNTTIERISEIAGREYTDMFSVVKKAENFPELSRAAEKLKGFAKLIEELADVSNQSGVEALYDAVLEKTGYAKALELSRSEEDLNRLENVKELKSFIVTHVKQSENSSLAGFLDEVSLYTDLQNVNVDENTVTLMTIHSAKGLEFPRVFLVGIEEGLFPSLMSIGDDAAMQEERRLAYVAITRAREELFITCARQRMVYGQTASHRVSRFIDDIPSEHMDRPVAVFDRENSFEEDYDPISYKAHDMSFYGRSVYDEKPRYPQRKTRDMTFYGKSVYDNKPKTALRAQSKPSVASAASLKQFEVGDRIRHKVFGEGVVKKLTPMGGDFLIEIEYVEKGAKRMMLNAARQFMEKLD